MNTKELLSIDWLSVNYIVECSPLFNGLEYHINNLKFIPEKYSTRQFRYVYYVYIVGQKEEIATIVCHPLSKILDARLHQVKLANWCLYTNLAKIYIREIKQALSAQYLSLSRLDVCIDMVGFDFYGFINDYHNNKIREKRPKEVTEHYKRYNNGSVYTGISWGSKSSDWTAKIYDKIREVNEVSGKQYILDYFEANGIDTKNEKVWRYEFSVNNVAKEYRINDEIITFDDENIFEFSNQLKFAMAYENLHAFAYNSGKVRFVDEKRYRITNLLLREIPPKRVRSSRRKKKDYSAKVSINLGMQLLQYQTCIEAYITYKNILEVARDYNLSEWLIRKYGEELQKIYIEKSFVMYGAGIKRERTVDLFTKKEYIE